MASIARQTTQRLVSSGISAPRALSTSAVASAAAKGKPAKGSAPSKKAQQGFSKKQPAKAGGGGSGGGGSGSKSITLRYENALPAPDLSDLPLLHPETVIASNVGTAAIIPSEALEKIKAFGLPRRLDKELARGPAVIVVRDQTIDIAKRIDGVKQSSSATGAQETIILAGEQGTGKSTILLQSVTHALNSGWLVLYIPKASEWISSSSPYMYNTTTQQFSQPALASALLDKLIKVNSDALAKVTTDEGKSVLEVAKRGVGVDAGEASVEILRKVMAALGKQSEVPVMIAIDEIQALFSKSEYLTPTGGAVESYHLSTPRLFLDYLTGRETLQSGLILTALSQSTPSLPISPTLAHALSLPTTRAITPYTELHPHHLAHAQAVLGPSPASLASASAGAGDKADEKGKSTGKGKGEVVEVKGYTPKEAAGVFGILARLGRTGAGGVGDEAYLSAMTIAAGNPLKFTRSIARSLHA